MAANETLTDILRDAIPLQQVPDFVPGRPHVATVFRWSGKGCRGVKLQTWLLGGKRVTTPAALEQFLLALNAAKEPPVSDSERARRAREAGKALEAIGA